MNTVVIVLSVELTDEPIEYEMDQPIDGILG